MPLYCFGNVTLKFTICNHYLNLLDINILLIVRLSFAKWCYFLVSYHSSFWRAFWEGTTRAFSFETNQGVSFIANNISSITAVSLSKPTATHTGKLPKIYYPNTLSWKNSVWASRKLFQKRLNLRRGLYRVCRNCEWKAWGWGCECWQVILSLYSIKDVTAVVYINL